MGPVLVRLRADLLLESKVSRCSAVWLHDVTRACDSVALCTSGSPSEWTSTASSTVHTPATRRDFTDDQIRSKLHAQQVTAVVHSWRCNSHGASPVW